MRFGLRRITQMSSHEDFTIRAALIKACVPLRPVGELQSMRKKEEQSEQPIDLAAYVGLDWADKEHAITLRAAGSAKLERFKLQQTPEAIGEWIAKLRARFKGGKVGIALEQSKGAVISALLCHDFFVLYPINPNTLASYREAFRPSKAKDDPTDADYLEELVEMHRQGLRAWLPDDEDTRLLWMLTENRRKFVDEKTRLTNRATSALKQYYPQAFELAGDLDTLRACAFLEKWPTLDDLKKTAGDEIRKFYSEHGYRGKAKVQERLDRAEASVPLTTDRAVIEGSAFIVRASMAQVRVLLEAIAEIEERIAELFSKSPDMKIFTSLPGAGKALAPRLSAVIGTDRNKFDLAEEIQSMSGIAPVTESSGQSRFVYKRTACNHFVRQTFQEFAGRSISESEWASAYYAQQRRRGKKHHAAVRALAYKWIRIIYRCWKDQVPYNEQKYIESLKRRGSSLVSLLSPAQPAG